MRKYITSDLNRLSWKIRRKTGVSWGDAFSLSLALKDVPYEVLDSPNSVLGQWGHINARNLASHFWSLSKAYQEVNDFGRSIAMKGVAKYLYKTVDEDVKSRMDLSHFAAEHGISVGAIQETFDYFASANSARITKRSEQLVMCGAEDFRKNLKIPYWAIR
jgi:hypothetical protein